MVHKKDEVMAFGGAMNDLEMSQMVKYGFVMKNGKEFLKEKIGCVVPYICEEDGNSLYWKNILMIPNYLKLSTVNKRNKDGTF